MHGLPTIGTIGFGWLDVRGRSRVASPPAITTAFMVRHLPPRLERVLRRTPQRRARRRPRTARSARPCLPRSRARASATRRASRSRSCQECSPRSRTARHQDFVPGQEQHVAGEDDQRRDRRQAPSITSARRRRRSSAGRRADRRSCRTATRRASAARASRRVGRSPRLPRRARLPPRRAVARGEEEHGEDRNREEAQHGERVRQLPQRRRHRAGAHTGRLWRAAAPLQGRPSATATTLELPGFVSAHSHAFQRALRGRAAGPTSGPGATRCSPRRSARRRSSSARATRRSTASLRRAGHTAVGEFHYLGAAEARAAAQAAGEPGSPSSSCTSRTRGGLARMRQESVGAYLGEVEALRADGMPSASPHFPLVRAPDWLEAIGRYADASAAAARPRGRTAARDRRMPRGARLPPDRAARTNALPDRAVNRRARDPRRRSGARPARLHGATVCVARRPRPTSATGSFPPCGSRTAASPARRPTRTCASTRSRSCASWRASHGGRAAAAGLHDRGAARDRLQRRRAGARARDLAEDRDRSGPSPPRGRRARVRAGRAARRLRRGRRRAGLIGATPS